MNSDQWFPLAIASDWLQWKESLSRGSAARRRVRYGHCSPGFFWLDAFRCQPSLKTSPAIQQLSVTVSAAGSGSQSSLHWPLPSQAGNTPGYCSPSRVTVHVLPTPSYISPLLATIISFWAYLPCLPDTQAAVEWMWREQSILSKTKSKSQHYLVGICTLC